MPARGRGSTRGRGGRGGGRGKKTGRPSNGASTSRKSTGRPWDDSDSDNARPDFYSDSDHSDLDSDDLSSPLRGKKTVIKLPGLEDEADDVDDEEMSEAGSFSADEHSRDQWSESRKTPTPDTFVCPWVEASDSMPTLTLPPSSDDLLLPSNILFEALEVYEVCRTFYSSIKLSPFLFEDMCAALLAQEQSRLLAEMHINLLKLLLKDDEDEQIVFCPTDMNNTANIVIHLLEPMTYAEVLRQYIESDPMRFPADVLAAVSTGNYPFVPIRQRLTVLGWLCDRFLQSGEFRRIVRREGRIEHDEHCRDCGKPGNVILCDGCEACYHLVCTDLKTVPDGQWLCGICQLHKVVGVHDCTSPLDRSRQPIRQEPIGFDRHGRRYWYLVRRIFVQDENTGQLWYYSSLPQFRQLCALLDPVDYEWRLCAVFQDILPSIVKQMRTTMSLTGQMKLTPVTYLGADNRERMREIRAQLDAKGQSNFEDEDEENSLVSRIDSQLGVNSNIDSFWMGLEDESSGEGPPPLTAMIDSAETMTPMQKYRLGQDAVNGYRKYVNQYSTSDYAKTPYARAKERDRTKYMSNKFSLIDEGEFEWPTIVGKDLFGSAQLVASLLQWSMNRLLQKIPVQLMHRRWLKEGQPAFKQALESANTPELLREQLLLFENCLRRCLLSQVWQDTLGHTRLLRSTSEDREWRQKIDKKRKADERALISADPNDEDNDVVWVKYTKLNGPPKHNLWKLKDEQYRVNGLRELGGWIWVSATKTLRLLPPGPKPPLGITAATQEEQLSSTSARKAHKLETLMAKLTGWREDQHRVEVKKRKRDALLACYSPSCRRAQMYSLIAGPLSDYQKCYSGECRRRQKQLDAPQVSDTRCSVRIVASGGRPSQRSVIEASKAAKLGTSEPYPLPKPFNFISKSRHSSVLLQPPISLKRMARQGGVGSVAPFGFSTHSKSNSQVWPYPCQRPLFETCWRYLTQNARSLHAVALQLRILHACVRWADMTQENAKEMRVTIHHDDHDEIREVVGHLELPPSGLTERYRLRVQLFPLDDESGNFNDDDQNDPYYAASPTVRTPRGGNGERKLRQTPALKKTVKRISQPPTVARPTLVERWANGADLKLSEIRYYWIRFERDMRAKALQLQRPALTPVSSLPGKAPTIIARQSIGGQAMAKRSPNVLSMGGNAEPGSTAARGGRSPLILSGGLRGGGKFNYVQKPVKSADGLSRAVLDPSTMLVTDDQSPLSSGMRSSAVNSPVRVVGRGGSFTGGVRPIAGKLLMIRRADGTTQLLRPVTTVKPEERVTAASLTGAEQRGGSVASLDDHAGMAQPARTAATRGRPPLSQLRGASTATRFIRVQGTPAPVQTQPMRTMQSVRGIRVQTGGVEVRDPFMARMAADDDAPTLTPAFGSPTVRRRGTGDTYAGYYGEKSNDRIDIDEYQQLAERGFRPPGRPPGRLASTFGYGPQASSNSSAAGLSPVKPIKVMTTPSVRGRGRGGRVAATTVIGPDFRTVTKIEPSPLPSPISKTPTPSLAQEPIVVHSAKGAYMIANPPSNSPRVRRVTSYKEYCQQNGMEFKPEKEAYHSRTLRPPRFEFETNEEEERAIAEAIAREEELMRIEEESKSRRSYGGREADFQRIEEEILRKEAAARREIQVRAKIGDKRPTKPEGQRFTTTFGREDKSDAKICRQVLDSIVSQVCRLDKQYGWSKQLAKNRPRDRKDYDRQYRARKAMQKALENVVSERIDRLRKEVCKRRLDLEKRAEIEAGLGISTWRKGGKARPGAVVPIRHGGKRPRPITTTVIDPSQISLSLNESASPPPAKKFRPIEEPSVHQWQPPKSTPTLAAAMAGVSRQKEEKKKYHKRMTRSPSPSAPVVLNGSSGAATPPTTIDPTQMHCICKTPYDPTKFYVGCDLCYRWYHGKCIGISEKKAKKINSYTCDDCSTEQTQTEQELYCVCRTPYNDTQFYVGCDGCEGWFHPACVGITQAEAERASEYICPNCQGDTDEASTSIATGPTLTRADYPLLWRLLESLTEHRTSWPFREPVDVEKYPNYYKIVKEPMDLSRVQRKLDDLEYHRLQDFIYDIGKIFDNARLFNPKDSPISQCADILEKRFRENLQSVKEEMGCKTPRRNETQSFSESAGGVDDSFLDEEAIDVDY